MSKMVWDVFDFHELFGLGTGRDAGLYDDDLRELRLNLITEEFNEVVQAFEKRDIENVAQELIDLIYVTIGAAISFNIPVDRVWNEVHRANMDKYGGEVRADGKILKPKDWTPPDIKGALGYA